MIRELIRRTANAYRAFFDNHAPMAPEIPTGTLCPCGQPATDQWFPAVCALIPHPEKREWKPICVRCDIKINTLVVFTLFGETDEAKKMVEDYAAAKWDDTYGH